MTWTLFAADGTGYIYEAYSRDYGEHFSAPKLVSTRQRAVHQRPRRPDAAGHAATRTSSRSRSPGPTARSTSCGTTSTSPACGPARATTRAAATARPTRRRRASTTAARCCWPSRPTAATPSRRRSRSPTTTTCPTARPTRTARTRAAPACPEKGETANSIFRAANYPSGAVNPRDPKRDRRHVRLLHQPPLQRGQRLRAAGLQPGHVPAALRRRQDAGRVQQRHRRSAGRRTAARRSPAARRTCARCRPRAARPRADQFWQWAAFDPRGPAGRVVLRPRLRRRRDDRVLGRQPVRHAQRQRLRHHARHDSLDAAADRSSAACSSATTAG